VGLAGSYIIKFNMPAYPGLYPSFPVTLSTLDIYTFSTVEARPKASPT